MVTLSISNAFEGMCTADEAELDCGNFDIVIGKASMADPEFSAAVARHGIQAKKRKLGKSEPGTFTGSYEGDVRVFCESVFKRWGERPMRDDEGNEVPFTKENLHAICMHPKIGRTFFFKIRDAALVDDTFDIVEDDVKN